MQQEARSVFVSVRFGGLPAVSNNSPDMCAGALNAMRANDKLGAQHRIVAGRRARTLPFFHQPKDTNMYWDRITDKLKQFAGAAGEQWGRLSNDQLDVITGKGDYIAGNTPDTHAMSIDDTEKHLADWQSRVKEMRCVNGIRQVSRRQYERRNLRFLHFGVGQFDVRRRRPD